MDIAIQPGDGGWGADVELTGFHRLFHDRVYGYVQGFYLFNPRNTNGARTPIPIYGQIRSESVPDQYLGRVGVSWAVWPEEGVTLSVGGRIDGIPVYDAIGESDGFRRPGYSIYVEPGLSWTHDKNTVNLFVPAGVAYNREENYPGQAQQRARPGSVRRLPDHLRLFAAILSRRAGPCFKTARDSGRIGAGR